MSLAETELDEILDTDADAVAESRWPRMSPTTRRRLKHLGIVLLIITSFIDLGLFAAWGSRVFAPTRRGWTCLPVVRGGLICQNVRSWYRGRSYAKKECVDALVEAAEHVSDCVPGARVAYMDASDPNGGSFMKHRSHRDGVDIDVMFIGRTWYGVPYPAGPSLFTVGYDLNYDRSRRHGSLTFDAKANWLFIEGLYGQKSRPVEAVFVEPYIKEWLLEAAKEMNAPKEETQWAATVLAYAGSGAGDHKDHFHVRFAR